ncbi:MAG TPA: alkylhydroperoxidase, partial [Planctomycetaceae bacterium]|nr:alkylhydroperoxidase [Planctomycetaceae bacterium]
MQVQGAQTQVASTLAAGDANSDELSTDERALLNFAKLITESAYKTTASDVQKLRDTGWSDEQIAEAVYVIAMFAFFNRVADAFGLQNP